MEYRGDNSRLAEDVVRLFLLSARNILDKIFDGEKIIYNGGGSFGDLNGDVEIKADRELGIKLIERLSKITKYKRVTIEGLNDIYSRSRSPLWFCIDPLDGSLNYRSRGRTLGLPFSTCITVLSHSYNRVDLTIFKNVIAAGVVDLRNGDMWISYKESGIYHTFINGEEASVAKVSKLDLGSMIVFGEMYYPENRERLAKAFAGVKGWLRNSGSSAYEMAMVASGQAVAFICDRQKQHELGAAYALVKGAGGVVVDFDGNDIGQRIYDFKSQTPVVLAANESIARQILEKIH